MDAQALRGNLATKDEETPGFLCAVAAESVNDAILLLDGLVSEAEPHLRRAREILNDCVAEQNGPFYASGQSGETHATPKPTLSASAIDLLVEQRLREDEAQQVDLDILGALRRRTRAQVGDFHRHRQRAIMLMIEALSLLDQLGDTDAIVHLQLAIDRAMEGGSSESPGLCIDSVEHSRKPN
ncbi:MAG: hypothetical protein J7498_01890 [Sphingobium sp.]|nr:hypothetical protein [Sphingobium sp.]